jgi:hypothetical protein
VRLDDLGSRLSAQDGLLDLCDCLGYLNTARAGLGAVEGGAATPNALFVIQDVNANLSTLVSGVKDKAVSVHDCGRAKVLTIGPEHWAAGGAGCTQDALGGVVEASSVLRGLQALLLRLVGGN